VQVVFGKLFNAGTGIDQDVSRFESCSIGELTATMLHVPGHTPADIVHVIGDAVFAGDTLFIPDFGTARSEFPEGDVHQLFRSIRRPLSLPRESRIVLCHDYEVPGRDAFVWRTTIGVELDTNVHSNHGVREEDSVAPSGDLALSQSLGEIA
jgi:glyoxylase-like metal-dependent hydrolase (beta-lactamase superfamily II)